LRHYPSEVIATSWDPDWQTTTQGIDCTGFGLGAPMPMEPAAAEAAAAAAAAETDGKCFKDCDLMDWNCRYDKPGGHVYTTKTACDNAGRDYNWKTTAELDAEAAIEAATPGPPTMTTGTGGPHDGGIVWQSHNIGGRFKEPGGLAWFGGNQPGDQPWDQSYKFRCENSGYTSSFSPTYGPVNFRSYHKPKIQVSDEGTTPCQSGAKLEVWDAKTNNNITSLMKNIIGTVAYNGTDHIFYDDRDVGTTLAAPTGTCKSKVQGNMGDHTCGNYSGWDCENRSTCKLV
jgi:hypothetical protein